MIITVSRVFGSGGSDVAANVAGQLGWTLLDNDVVDSVAERLGMSSAEVSDIEERVPTFAERIATSMRMSTPEYVVPIADASLTDTAEMRVVDTTKRVMEEAVQRGNVVVVGRGAQVLLADRPDALHVFCYAAPEVLVQYVITHHGVDPDAAPQEVEKRNRQREQYIRRNFGRDWRRFENYHLCLDTGRLGIDAAADLVVAAARSRFNLGA
ncbi:MAG TPA: cytidylate kinase-like family protein [Gemmatimonadaceae bacterium]|nr:cytidylate kinase-like family protein [Gemmatimonadaceae bacterium]